MRREDDEAITVFSIPKPFRGLVGITQRNAIRSWLKLIPKCEIILLGDDDGVAEVASEFGVRHGPKVARNEFGTPLFDSAFETAESMASNRLLAYVNTDIILMSDFLRAVMSIPWASFVMGSRRWNLAVTHPLDFQAADWEEKLRNTAISSGYLIGDDGGSDYLVFPRGMWTELLPFAVGRPGFELWLIYRARMLHVPVVDASSSVMAVHQLHDYSHFVEWNGWQKKQSADIETRVGSYRIASTKEWREVFCGSEESKRYWDLVGERGFCLLAATWLLTPRGLRRAISRKHLRYHLGTLPILYPRFRPIFQLARRLLKRSE